MEGILKEGMREGSKIMNGTEGRRSEIRLMKERT